jgi:hypothetical protein
MTGTPLTVLAAADTMFAATTAGHPLLKWPPDRKLRLFACGCCRTAWGRLTPACRRAVRVAELFADGLVTVTQLGAAGRACRKAEATGRPVPVPRSRPRRYYQVTEHIHLVALAALTPADVRDVALDLRPWRGDSVDNDDADAARDRMLSDVFGGPWRQPELHPPWRTAAVLRAARWAYLGRTHGRIDAVADALAAAGCDEQPLLDHCRNSEVHVRGCWALDRVLGLG